MSKENIEQMLNEEINTWIPKENESIIGFLKEKRAGVGKFNSILYVLDVDGKLYGIWGSSVIDQHLANVPIGSQVGIKFVGMAKSDKGNNYKNFRVVVEPNADEQ